MKTIKHKNNIKNSHKKDIFKSITTRSYASEQKDVKNPKNILLIINLFIGLIVLVPLHIILISEEITVYIQGIDQTSKWNNLIWVDGVTLIVTTYWRYKLKKTDTWGKNLLIIVQLILHGIGLLTGPKIYSMHLISKHNNQNGYSPFGGMWIEHNWSREEIRERVEKVINEETHNKINEIEKIKILNEAISEKNLEECVNYAKLKISEFNSQKEALSWNDWIYNSLNYCKNGLLWSFSSEGYYIGYVVLGGASLLLGYYYRTGKMIEATTETDVGIRDLIKGNKDLAEALKQTNAAVGLVNAEVRKLGDKVSSLESFQQTQHGINDALKDQIKPIKDARLLINKITENPEDLKKLSSKVINADCLQYNQENNQVTNKSIVNLINEITSHLTEAGRKQGESITKIGHTVNNVIEGLKNHEVSNTQSFSSIWTTVLDIASRLDKQQTDFEQLQKLAFRLARLCNFKQLENADK